MVGKETVKKLIYTVGFDPLYFRLADMMCHTIRQIGRYEDDLVILASSDAKSQWAETVNVTTHPDGQLLRTNKSSYFHKHIPRRFRKRAYALPYDYFMVKTLPGKLIDRDKYDMIFYFDSDMLICGDLNPIFEHNGTLVSGAHGHKVIDELRAAKPDASRFLTDDQRKTAETMPTIGGGVVGVPRSLYDFYDRFRENYLLLLNETKHDMPALALTLIQGGYPHVNLPRNGTYWVHYWGEAFRKKKMIADYENMFNPPRLPANVTTSDMTCERLLGLLPFRPDPASPPIEELLWLYNLVKSLSPKRILEGGADLTTAVMLLAAPAAQITAIDASTSPLWDRRLAHLRPFVALRPTYPAAAETEPFDLFFLDSSAGIYPDGGYGHHLRGQALLAGLLLCRKDAVIVFHDRTRPVAADVRRILDGCSTVFAHHQQMMARRLCLASDIEVGKRKT